MVGRVGLEPTTTRFLVRGCLAFHITVIEDIIMSDKDFLAASSVVLLTQICVILESIRK